MDFSLFICNERIRRLTAGLTSYYSHFGKFLPCINSKYKFYDKFTTNNILNNKKNNYSFLKNILSVLCMII